MDFDPEAFISGEDTTDPYKQALIDKIQSGVTDYTYGPGSPGATSADMRQKTGARDNALQTGDIALPEKDYNLFTPQERQQLGIADTSWIKEGQPTPRGSVERYFGPEQGAFNPEDFIKGKPQPSETPSGTSDIHAFLEPAPAEEATPETTETGGIGKALGEGIGAAAKAIGASASTKLNLPRVQINQPFTIPTAGQQPAPLIGQTPPPILQTTIPQPAPIPTPDLSQQFQTLPQMLPPPQPQTLPVPPPQPTFNAPVMQGGMEGLQQTVSGLIPHTMEQFQGLAQLINAPSDPQQFFKSALEQGLVTSQIAQAAIKAGPLSKEAGVAYGTILPQVLMAAGGLGEAGALPNVRPVVRSLTGQNMLPRAQQLGGIGITGGPREVPVPEAFQPKGATQGDYWYQGVATDGATQWVTHDPKIAADYAKRRGEGAKVNVYTADQVGATAFEGSPQEYAKNNWSTTIQTAGGKLPKPIKTLSIAEAEGLHRPAPQLSEPLQFSVDMPTDTFATEHTPVSNALHEMKVQSKSGAQRAGRYKGNEALWNDVPALSHPTHNKIYSPTGTMPDVAAQNLFDAGLIHEPSVQAMWNAVGAESKSARSTLGAQRSDAVAVTQAAKQQATQTKSFNAAETKAWKGGQPAIPVKDLQVGDKVTVGGEQFKVTDIDPDTHDVTLEDGSKYGVQSVKDGTVIYGQLESKFAKPSPKATPPPAAATPPPRRPASTPPPRQPPAPPSKPPPSGPAAPKPSYSESLNPVADYGPFSRTYRIDKELGEKMDSLGAAPETGALVAETQSRNMLHELTEQQEADLGKLLLSDRLRRVNPQHPQVIFDSVARGIESDPAIAKALDYYRKEVEPELEEIGKRAGLKEPAAATQRGAYFTLVPERLPDGTVPELAPRFGQTSRTTKYSLPAEGQAAKYSTDIRQVLRESYTERIRKAAARDLFDAAHGKGVVESTPQFVPDPENGPTAGKWVNTIKEGSLPEGMKHDLNLIAQGKSTMQPEGIQKVLQKYQRGATAVQLGMNPLEIMNHLRRQLHILASKPPIGQGVMARMEAVAPYFGPKVGALKRAMSDMSTPARQQILKDITSAGGGSSRAFREKYGTQLPVLKQVSDFTNKLLFGYPSGKGVMGFDLRMRVLLEEIRRNAEPHLANDKQRMRQFSNQMGQYGTMASWPVRALRHVNPYAATTLQMRWAELRTLVGGSGLRSTSIPQALVRRAETFARGTGGTIAMLTIANKLLSGNWPWQNRPGHEFDLKTGVKDKAGNDIYVPNRFLSPELFRAISTYSVPQLLAERGAPNRSALSETAAATLGPVNAGLSLLNSPAASITLAAIPQWAMYAEKWPGEKKIGLMNVGEYTARDQARGIPPLLKRAEGVAEQLHPALAAIVGYMDEPIKGLRPLGILKVDKPYGGGRSRSYSTGSGRGTGGRSSGRGIGGR